MLTRLQGLKRQALSVLFRNIGIFDKSELIIIDKNNMHISRQPLISLNVRV